jgi:hypothetical protein
MKKYDTRHGGAYDRGSADAYYFRVYRPHMFEGATCMSKELLESEMSQEDLDAYRAGYDNQQKYGDFKNWKAH